MPSTRASTSSTTRSSASSDRHPVSAALLSVHRSTHAEHARNPWRGVQGLRAALVSAVVIASQVEACRTHTLDTLTTIPVQKRATVVVVVDLIDPRIEIAARLGCRKRSEQESDPRRRENERKSTFEVRRQTSACGFSIRFISESNRLQGQQGISVALFVLPIRKCIFDIHTESNGPAGLDAITHERWQFVNPNFVSSP
jgi:hypothetical protein